MAELTVSERLQPSLLDRLTDDNPESRQESRERRVMSMRQLRMAVLRDLGWLLNAPCNPRGDTIYDAPLVAKSVVNYGIPDLTGLSASGLSLSDIERMVQDAILNFEPRILRAGLTVRVLPPSDDPFDHQTPQRFEFEISGDLCPLPMPEALYVRTEVDLETGRCEIKDRA
ncbi:MAG: type VI secretion system baseplate subunit TssE [Phycisphaeraceae bacterium]|nr:type VI secretion system baseplate subunit TssE [Phycisphaeraceae bacterium]